MERKLRNATSKLRNLKDFLSSTRSLSQHNQGPSTSTTHPHQKRGSKGQNAHVSNDGGRPSLSVSLFDLVDPPLSPSRPNSMAFSGPGSPSYVGPGQQHSGSVSMHALAGASSSRTLGEDQSFGGQGQGRDAALTENRPAVLSSKNPALRLFYTIRSKFRKRKRDRLNKIVDSKSTNDFGPFMSGSKYPVDTNSSALSGRQSSGSLTRYQLEVSRFPCSQSVNHLDYMVDEFDNSFSSPLGSRDRNYEMDKENSAANISYSVIQDKPSSCLTPSTPSPLNVNPPKNLPGPFSEPCAAKNLFPIEADGDGSCSSDEPCSSSSIISSKPSTAPASASTSSAPTKLKGLAKELFDLIHFGWYWGGLSKEDAEEKLRNEPDGAFIVRDSSSSLYLLTLSFNSNGKTKHTRIEYVDGKFSFMSSETESFPSVAELIQHWIQNTEKGILCYSKSARAASAPASYPVRLTKPISRFTEVKSLRFLASFVIYQYTRLDLIPKLPLPPPLINFIGQQRFLEN